MSHIGAVRLFIPFSYSAARRCAPEMTTLVENLGFCMRASHSAHHMILSNGGKLNGGGWIHKLTSALRIYFLTVVIKRKRHSDYISVSYPVLFQHRHHTAFLSVTQSLPEWFVFPLTLWGQVAWSVSVVRRYTRAPNQARIFIKVLSAVSSGY